MHQAGKFQVTLSTRHSTLAPRARATPSTGEVASAAGQLNIGQGRKNGSEEEEEEEEGSYAREGSWLNWWVDRQEERDGFAHLEIKCNRHASGFEYFFLLAFSLLLLLLFLSAFLLLLFLRRAFLQLIC